MKNVKNFDNFNQDLTILLNGYLILGKILKKLENSSKSTLTSQNPKKFFENGYKLSLKYLGSSNFFSKMFNNYLFLNNLKILIVLINILTILMIFLIRRIITIQEMILSIFLQKKVILKSLIIHQGFT